MLIEGGDTEVEGGAFHAVSLCLLYISQICTPSTTRKKIKTSTRSSSNQGYGRFRKDLGGPEEQAMHGSLARAVGKYAEAISFEGDNSRLNPFRYLPGQVQTKLWQERTAYSQYLQQEAIGTRMRRRER